ncbi:hypothetical protein HZC31_05670 [Candidatus Woesearchaeota archaeon]|nr:hypothetical protein [Candidatus Woesearchaeota archaeon]
MAKEQKTNLYLLSIVAIVAIVGIVVLILNSGAGSVSLNSDDAGDLTGEAYKKCKTACKIDETCFGGNCVPYQSMKVINN